MVSADENRDRFAVTRDARRATPLHLQRSATETRHSLLQRVASSVATDGDALHFQWERYEENLAWHFILPRPYLLAAPAMFGSS